MIEPPAKVAEADDPVYPISQSRRVGSHVHFAGQIGMDRDTQAIPPEFEAQMRIALANLTHELAQYGATMESIVSTRVYLVRRDDFHAMNRIYAEHWGEPYPTRCTLIVGLALPELLFEIEAIAHLEAASNPGSSSVERA
jgi:2-iminobutanoate/2-iminopropanoate deaminase